MLRDAMNTFSNFHFVAAKKLQFPGSNLLLMFTFLNFGKTKTYSLTYWRNKGCRAIAQSPCKIFEGTLKFFVGKNVLCVYSYGKKHGCLGCQKIRHCCYQTARILSYLCRNGTSLVGAVVRSLLFYHNVPSSIPALLRFEYLCDLLFHLS